MGQDASRKAKAEICPCEFQLSSSTVTSWRKGRSSHRSDPALAPTLPLWCKRVAVPKTAFMEKNAGFEGESALFTPAAVF